MKTKLFKALGFVMVVAMMLTAFGVGHVSANARTLSWAVSITYQNVGTGQATVSIDFYQPSGTDIPYALPALNAGAAASLYIGAVTDVPSGFRGSAVMSSNQPLVATVVQFHPNGAGETVKVRMLSNGFTGNDGSSQFLLATVLANTFSQTVIFSVQNTESETVTATIKFYDLSGNLASTKSYDIPTAAAKYIEMDNTTDTGLPTNVFNGSAVVTAVLKSNAAIAAKVVASEGQYYTNKDVASAFEGIPLSKAATTLYMATGLCKSSNMDTVYAVQNASLTTATSITVTYYNIDGSPKTTDGPYPIGAGQKKSITTCAPSSGMSMTGFSGSAKVVSTVTPIAAIGRAQGSAGAPASVANVFTAFMGESTGYAKVALPFVRYANDAHFNASNNYGSWQRTYLAIQNVSGVPGNAIVKYVDKAGNVVATQTLTIAAGAKGNSNPLAAGATGTSGMNAGEFGYYTDGTFGGGVTIEVDPTTPGASFIAIARVQNPGMGEDYNGASVPTP
jgi:hypothetical protein